jgi:hypothetical protein
MAELKVYQEYGEEIERRLRLKTFPLQKSYKDIAGVMGYIK